MPTDEDLAKLLYIAYCGEDFDDFHDLLPGTRRQFDAMARAVRAALCPPVEPLRPGETVTIPDSVDPDGRLRLSDLEGLDGTHELRVDADAEDEGVTLSLDDAGVTLLEETCRRWRLSREKR